MTNRSEAFGRLLKAGISSIVSCEGKKAPIVEDELGQQIGVSGDSIQRYKAGYLPPESRTVQILAEACVRRGYLGREWLQRFLHAARYPFADQLLSQLCPVGPARTRPPRVYENLPAPTYSQFVMRTQAFAEVLDGLAQRSAVVLIVGLGGNGKTSLAREVAARCLQDSADGPRFDAIVWVSDKDRPGTTNLSTVLNEIARTLDYPGFTQFAHDEKLYEVGQLLKRQRVLVVIDNFETISDSALLAWLLRLPEPSKALITSREKHRGLWSSWLAELRGMSEAEAQTLIHQRLRALQLDKLASNPADFEPLIIVTGGNPKAIEIALGLVKHERRPLQHVVDDLHAARGELFDDLFTRAWALLDEAARRVLLVMTFFPASASSEALSATADVQGFAFDRAVERLIDLALLDVQQEDLNSVPRYMLHPLVRAFAGAKLKEQHEFEIKARERWVNWYVELVSVVGYAWNNLMQLKELDQERDTIFSALLWVRDNSNHVLTCQIAKNSGYYYYVRGDWNRLLSLHNMLIEAAFQKGEIETEIQGLVYAISVVSEQGNIVLLPSYLGRLQERITHIKPFASTLKAEVLHAKAMAKLAFGETEAARQDWLQSVEIASHLDNNRASRNRYWLGVCYRKLGMYGAAQEALQEGLEIGLKQNYERGLVSFYIEMANLAIIQSDVIVASNMVHQCEAVLSKEGDSRSLALITYAWGQLHTLRGDLPAAHAALIEAIDLFERLGMRREFAEARADLAQLDEQIAARPSAVQ